MQQIVIIIPTYNEAEVIEKTVREIFREAAKIFNKTIQILIFDSASTDGTQQKIIQLQQTYQHLHLKTESQKSGLGSAYLQAMRYTLDELNADVIIEFDADLSHQPQYLSAMLEQLKTCDVVIGSRYISGGSIPKDWGVKRKLLSVLGNYTARFILSFKYKDWTSGFRASRTSILSQVLPTHFLSNQYAYKLHLLWLLHKRKAKINEYPIVFLDRKIGKSKLPSNSIFDSLRVLCLLRFTELKTYFKMCVVGISGITLQFITFNLLRFYLPVLTATQLGVLIASLNNFILNKQFTFKRHPVINRMQKLKSFLLFIVYSLLMIYMQGYWLHLVTSYIGQGILKENLVLLGVTIITSFINYFTYSNFIWPKIKFKEPLNKRSFI
ncbi:glycosyltransferase (plasmid) [Legionella sp. D16C41]|uniref:glycosyltransferase n=1 Tax=Legionella sp. D16C41 TaxID=3402688 RepID=UPI003AF9C478